MSPPLSRRPLWCDFWRFLWKDGNWKLRSRRIRHLRDEYHQEYAVMVTAEQEAALRAEGIDHGRLRSGSHAPLLHLSFSNLVVFILFELADKSAKVLRLWFYHLAGLCDEGDEGDDLLPRSSLFKRIKAVKKQVRNIGRRNRAAADALLAEKFTMPNLKMSLFPAAGFVVALASAAVRKVSGAADVAAEKEREAIAANAAAASSILNAQKLETKLGRLKRTLHNTQRQAKRAKLSTSALVKAKYASMRTQRSLRQAVAVAKSLTTQLRSKLMRALRRKCAVCPQKDLKIAQQASSLSQLRENIAEMHDDMRDSDLLIADLNDALAVTEPGTVQAKSGFSYSVNMQECMLRLQALSVSQGAIGQVINTVLNCLLGKQLSNIPSRRTVGRLTPVGLALSQQQVAAIIPNASNSTLYSDETTKAGTKVFTFVAGTEKGEELVLGLRETIDKSALSQLESLQSVVTDLGDAAPGDNVMHRIVASINNLMSDRAATQVKFNSLFDAWRQDCLPLADRGWSELPVEARQKLSVVNTFFCTLHLLANLADKMEESMEILESAHANTRVEPESCSVITLIRDIAKMFSLRSASRYGLQEKWLNFLSLKGKKDAPHIDSFLGHRFNILFVLAASIFQLRELLLEFCEDYEADNVALVPVVTRLRDKFIIGQLKVLGLLDKLVTGPLWRLAESDIHILDMGGEYRALIDWLGANVADPSGFLNGVPPTSPNGWKTVVDSRLASLIADQDPVVNEHLPIIAQQVLLTCKRYFECTLKDYLPEGKYFDAESGPLRNVTKSVLKTNRIPESVFGLTDYLFHRAPNMTMLTREALVLLLKNKTFAWYDKLSPEDKTAQLKLAKERGTALRHLYLQRKQALTEERKERLRKAKEDTVRQRMSAVVVRSNLTNQVAVYGLWTNELEVDMGLEKLTKPSEKLRALETQIRFRKNVLKQPGDRKLFAFSEKRAKHTWQKLKLNLTTLLVAAYSVAPPSDCLQLVGKRIEHRYEEDGEERWWPGTVTAPIRGTGPGGKVTYGVVYDTDVQRVYCCTVDDLTVDIDNGDLIVL